MILIYKGISRVAKRIPIDKLPSLGGLQGSKLKGILGEKLSMFDLSNFSAISLTRRTGMYYLAFIKYIIDYNCLCLAQA
jgi:hypothetical protein